VIRKAILTIVLAVIVALALYPQIASACSCATQKTTEEAFVSATAVFSGRVIAIGGPSGCTISSAAPTHVTFQVYEVWKGPEQSVIEITTELISASCGYEFAFGKSYLVYAYGEENDLKVSLCSRTGILSSATEDIQALGDSRASFCQYDNEDNSNHVSAVAISEEGDGFNYVAVITFVAGILFGLMGYAFWDKRRLAAK